MRHQLPEHEHRDEIAGERHADRRAGVEKRGRQLDAARLVQREQRAAERHEGEDRREEARQLVALRTASRRMPRNCALPEHAVGARQAPARAATRSGAGPSAAARSAPRRHGDQRGAGDEHEPGCSRRSGTSLIVVGVRPLEQEAERLGDERSAPRTRGSRRARRSRTGARPRSAGATSTTSSASTVEHEDGDEHLPEPRIVRGRSSQCVSSFHAAASIARERERQLGEEEHQRW